MAETINGYRLEKPLKTDNSGFSKWGFGEWDGREYFIKEFLSPVYPLDAALLGPELTEKRKEICRQYVLSKQLLFRAINEASDGNLVRVEHFFRYGSRFYIVMEKAEPVNMVEVLGLTETEKLRICMILAHGISEMHKAGLVHGDIKLDNVIFCRNRDGIGTKIIDLDTCFWEKYPPKKEEEIMGDQIYMAPETFWLIAQEEGILTNRIDVFALGILFHQIFTGMLPSFGGDDCHYAYEVLMKGRKLVVSSLLSPELEQIFSSMLERNPEDRPTMQTVYEQLQSRYRKLTRPQEAEKTENGSRENETWKNETREDRSRKFEEKETGTEFFFQAGEDDL